MVIIADDTYIERQKFQETSFLSSTKYSQLCKVYVKIRTTDIEDIEHRLTDCKLFCNHKSLQLYDIKGNALDLENNNKQRENILKKVALSNIQRIEFGRGIDTDFKVNKIDKQLFYSNLKAFLDYYSDTNLIEIRILYWGENYIAVERMSIIQEMLIQIRMNRLEEYHNNQALRDGLKIIYPHKTAEKIIEEWVQRQLSKNDIIKEINNQIN
jgi:hypothetical protein